MLWQCLFIIQLLKYVTLLLCSTQVSPRQKMANTVPAQHAHTTRTTLYTAHVNTLSWPICGHHCVMLMQAIANESGINFISVKGPELLNMVRSLVIIHCIYVYNSSSSANFERTHTEVYSSKYLAQYVARRGLGMNVYIGMLKPKT